MASEKVMSPSSAPIKSGLRRTGGLCIVLVFGFCGVVSTTANAAIYNYNGHLVDVDYWAGSGSNESIMVVDWQRDISLAFGYRWNAPATAGDMFDAVDAASTKFYKEWVEGQGDRAIFGIGYDIDGDGFSKEDTGDYYWQGWSTDSFWAEYLSANEQIWEEGNGIRSGYISNESWVGFSWTPDSFPSQPDPPIVPEPCSLAILGLGVFFLRRRENA